MEDFIWTDKLVKEYATIFSESSHSTATPEDCERAYRFFLRFKESKQPKKEYEILSFASTEGYTLCVLSRNENGTFGGFDAYEHSLLSSSLHKILSVKRLSDNEIFTVGDKIGWGVTGNYETNLKGFEIKEGKLFIKYGHRDFNDSVSFKGAVNLHKKLKTPLFTTEDGVAITDENQTLYAVLTKAQWQTREDTVKRMRERSSYSTPLNPTWKYFSTDEARQDYILKNKPLLSVNDICGLWVINYAERESLSKLAKSKL
jgi:hypothetical protein